MQMLSESLCFVSSNKKKFTETKSILEGFGVTSKVKLEFVDMILPEAQTDSIADVAASKAYHAFGACKKPVIVEDAGLEIMSLKKFPGPYSSYVYSTIGNTGILNLLRDDNNKKGRRACFHSVVAYRDTLQQISFSAKVYGTISRTTRGQDGWGYDPIFVPQNQKNDKTFAELGTTNKNCVSHRYRALKKFASWFLSGR